MWFKVIKMSASGYLFLTLTLAALAFPAQAEQSTPTQPAQSIEATSLMQPVTRYLPVRGPGGVPLPIAVSNPSDREAELLIEALAAGKPSGRTLIEVLPPLTFRIIHLAAFLDDTAAKAGSVRLTMPRETAVGVVSPTSDPLSAALLGPAGLELRIEPDSIAGLARLAIANDGDLPSEIAVEVRDSDGITLRRWSAEAPATGVFDLDLGDLPEDCSYLRVVSAKPIFAMLMVHDAGEYSFSSATIWEEAPAGENRARCAKPSIRSFKLDGGALKTADRSVRLDSIVSGQPTEFRASERRDFAGASWRTYAASAVFTLSSAEGRKTVYLQTRNACGSSSTRSDTITYEAPLGAFEIYPIAGCAPGKPVVQVSWTSPVGNPASFDVYRDGRLIRSGVKPATNTAKWNVFRDESVQSQQKYRYRVVARKGSLSVSSPEKESTQTPICILR